MTEELVASLDDSKDFRSVVPFADEWERKHFPSHDCVDKG